MAPNPAGLLVVVCLHASALYALWAHQMLPGTEEAKALFVSFYAAPVVTRHDEPKPPPTPARVNPAAAAPTPQIAAQAPVLATQDYVAPVNPAPVAPAAEVQAHHNPAPAAPAAVAPVALDEELSVICTSRPAPAYPTMSRRTAESGTVVVRVELDEQGQVSSAKVHNSSGFPRLDEAALAAVRHWQCTPPRRNGQNLRSVAHQPFRFFLQ